MIHTDDLILGAFALLRGGELEAVEVRGLNGRRVAFLRIAGQGLEEVLREYYRGCSVVDLRLLKCELRRLKDAVFAALRNEEEAEHAGGIHGGGDRPRQAREPHRAGRR